MTIIPYKYLKWTFYTAILLLIYYMQFTTGLMPELIGIRPLPVIPFVICVAMYEGEVYGGVFGIIAGLLWDFSANRVLGFNAIVLMILGIAVGLIITYLMQNNIYSAMILCGSSIFAIELFDWFFYYLLWGYDKPIYVFFRYYILIMIYTSAFIPGFHYFFKWIKPQIKEGSQDNSIN